MPTAATGLTGVPIFVRADELTAFEALKRDLVAGLKPADAHELHLFDVVLSSAWNIRRCIGVEAEIQNEADSLGLADPFFDDELTKKMDRINRYKRQYETSYRRAMKELKQLAAARRPESVDPPRQARRAPKPPQPIRPEPEPQTQTSTVAPTALPRAA